MSKTFNLKVYLPQNRGPVLHNMTSTALRGKFHYTTTEKPNEGIIRMEREEDVIPGDHLLLHLAPLNLMLRFVVKEYFGEGSLASQEYLIEVTNKDFDPPRTAKSIIEDFRSHNTNARFALLSTGESSEPSKWYSYEEELRNLSKSYPDVLFALTVDGDKARDLKVIHAYGGALTVVGATITYPAPDRGALRLPASFPEVKGIVAIGGKP